jgi:hypothetical protein
MLGQSVDIGCLGERVAKASDGGLEIVDADEQDVGPVGGSGEGDQGKEGQESAHLKRLD